MTAAEQVKEYRDHTFELGDIVELRAIASGGRVSKFWKQADDLLELVPELQRLNRAKFNIYIAPNPRKAEGLSGDVNVLLCRCLFADFDGVEPGDGCGVYEFIEPRIEAAGLPLPTMTIFSGHGCHCYWRLEEPITVERWQPLQERLIAALGSDKACKNPERFLRLPGFENHKFKTPADCFTRYAEQK